jgi:vacuolar protein sorting-associated protein IST1
LKSSLIHLPIHPHISTTSPSHHIAAARREIADLLRAGKTESARIRVEAVLRDTAMLAAYDILELHCELLGVRAAVIERVDARQAGVPADMVECVSSLAYAAVRVGADLPELPAISGQLRKKFGREWEAEAGEDGTRAKWHVNEALARALAVEVPPAQARLECLQAVAAEHGVTWDEATVAGEMGVVGEGGAATHPAATAPLPPPNAPHAAGEFTSAADAAAAARAAATRASAAADEAERLAGGGKVAAAATLPEKEASPKATPVPPPPPPPPAAPPLAGASMDEGEGSVNSQPLPPAEPAPSAGGSGSLGLPSPPENSSGGGTAASLGLPPAPTGGGGGGVVTRGGAGGGSDDLDELAKRFDLLKKK